MASLTCRLIALTPPTAGNASPTQTWQSADPSSTDPGPHAASLPTMTQGKIGAPTSSARRKKPSRKSPSRPVVVRVPSGNTRTRSPAASKRLQWSMALATCSLSPAASGTSSMNHRCGMKGLSCDLKVVSTMSGHSAAVSNQGSALLLWFTITTHPLGSDPSLPYRVTAQNGLHFTQNITTKTRNMYSRRLYHARRLLNS
mmetsp:Transcript_52882/g.116065  ORF Transcript_52882/g.116065 Transcript_52882/m.116065 type:complete len:200 (-) Transcript_52882:172-771(-)